MTGCSLSSLVSVYFILSLLVTVITGQQQYNVFKSYENSKNRPAQYAAQHRKHGTSEYLTPLQIKMLQYRKGPDNPKVMFTNPWSGFNKAQNANQGEFGPLTSTASGQSGNNNRRRLREVTSILQQQPAQSIRRIGVPLDITKNTEENPSKEDQQEESFEKNSFLMFSMVVMMLLGIVMFLGYGRIRRDKHHGSSRQHHQEMESTHSINDDDVEQVAVTPKNRDLESQNFGGVLTTAAAVVFTV